MSRRRPSSSSRATGFLFTVIRVSSIPRTTWSPCCLTSGWLGGGGWGSEMPSPFWASGVTTMKMMSKTSITSIRGVMLMSAIAPECSGWVASCECTIHLRFLCPPWAGAFALATGLALHLLLGDERHFLGPRLPQEVHDLHDLRVRKALVRLEVDHPGPLREVLEALLDLGEQLGLVVELGPAQVGRGVLLDRHHDRLGLVLPFLGVSRRGELHVHALLEHGGDHHEDDEEDDHDVGHGRDVDVRHRSALAAADRH